MKTRYQLYIHGLLLTAFLGITACKKLIDVKAPINSLNVINVYTNDGTAAAVLTGVYTNLSKADGGLGLGGMFLFPALSADELTLFDSNKSPYQFFYTNKLQATTGSSDWNFFYPLIYDSNAAIEGLNGSSTLNPIVKQQLLGEAYFVRAFCYFQLVNQYGGVPLAVSTDYKVNSSLVRAPQTDVWKQIVDDLHLAQNLLNSNFLKSDALTAYPLSSAERVRPTKWAATALLARSYLYTRNWTGADSAATAVINNTAMFSLGTFTGATRVFARNSGETIWALQPVGTGPTINTGEGLVFSLPITGPNTSGTYPVYLSNTVFNAFEPGDLRKTNWVASVTVGTTTYNYPNKYLAGRLNTASSEYAIQFRLAEQYLIRAEAEAHESKTSNAVADLNLIRSRAGLSGYAGGTDLASLQTAILHERQVELFTEGGYRWFDLKRTGTIDVVMGAGGVCTAKGGTWSTNWQYYPLPSTELIANPKLTQNPGY